MLKQLITPLQKVLMQKKLCPGCTRPLHKAKLHENKPSGVDIVICECGRIFVYDRDLDIYRRALNEDL